MPIKLTARSLKRYETNREIPYLPTQFEDDAGILMSNATKVIHKLDSLILYLADYDHLTGLPNRSLFQKHLNKASAATSSAPLLVGKTGLSLDSIVTSLRSPSLCLAPMQKLCNSLIIYLTRC
ncbi:MAG: GGDEF domain-containing protein [Leptolyngbyaceae cyanobacterium SL_1_1]|nr:GGDEF domain-containing protein [Leptolyngbyaceae cyanobacterium RM1_1_2]NJO10934.1 GGDEF domain-containing protein [Leptolyngbyaceae cyanobacterium SL_1_1]